MKQKINKVFLIFSALFYCLLPVLSYAANPLDSDKGLVVCGNGVGANSVESAIKGLYDFRDKPPSPSDQKYNPGGKFDSTLYNQDFENWRNKSTRSAEQNQRINDAWAKFNQNSCNFFDIFRQIVKLINVLMALAGIFFVVRIVIEGAKMVVYAGSGDQIKSARGGITNALLGFVLVLGAFAAVNVIFQLLAINLNLSYPLNPFK